MSTVTVMNKKATVWEVLLYCFAAAALPNIFLFNVYNQNRDVALIMFSHVLILALIFAVVSVAGLFVMRFLTRRYEGSFAVILVGWLFFWFFESIVRLLPINSRAIILGVIFLLLICLVVLFRFMFEKMSRIGLGVMAVAGIISMVFVFNAVPAVVGAISSPRVQVASGREDGGLPIRRYFNVDTTLQSPDIYWFHVDALVNMNDMERVFGTAEGATRDRLLELGFVINEEAIFIAHNTVFGTPGLLSPDLYDNYLHDIFMAGQHDFRGARQRRLFDTIEADGFSLANDFAPYHEIFHAFLQAGYRTVMIADFYPNVFIPIDKFYRLFDPSYDGSTIDQNYVFTVGSGAPVQNHFLIDARELIELLTLMTPLPARFLTHVVESNDLEWERISNHTERINELTAYTYNHSVERQLYGALLDLLDRPSSQPTFTYIVNMFGHPWSWPWIYDGPASPTQIERSIPSRAYAMDVTFNMIDLILERNPDAIIVIQADHGFHFARSQRALSATGLTDTEVIHLHDSVLSAVRIPEIYGGLDAPLDARNISRELVNRFVGQNYELRTDTR